MQKNKKHNSQIAKELSDIVIYIQVIRLPHSEKYRGNVACPAFFGDEVITVSFEMCPGVVFSRNKVGLNDCRTYDALYDRTVG